MKTIACIFCLLLTNFPLSAQSNNDPFYVNFSNFPKREMDLYSGKVSYSQIEVNAILPTAKFGTRSELYTVVNYKFSIYDYDNTDLQSFPDQLNDFRVGIIYRRLLGPNLEGVISPRLNARTDFQEKFGSKDLFPSAYLLFIKKAPKYKSFYFGLGISYNNDLNRNSILPLGYLKFQNSWMRVNMILPSFAYALITNVKRIEYGLAYNLDAAIFHVDRFVSQEEANYLQTRNITIAPMFSYNFANEFWFNGKIGYALPGEYQFLDSDFDAEPFIDGNKFKGGIFATIGISLRFDY